MKIYDIILSVISIIVITAFIAGIAYGGVSLLRMDNGVDGPPHFEDPVVVTDDVYIFQRDGSIFLEYLDKEYDFNENIATIDIVERFYDDKKIEETVVKYIVFDGNTEELFYKEMTIKSSTTKTAKIWRKVSVRFCNLAGLILLIFDLFMCAGLCSTIYHEFTDPFKQQRGQELKKEGFVIVVIQLQDFASLSTLLVGFLFVFSCKNFIHMV